MKSFREFIRNKISNLSLIAKIIALVLASLGVLNFGLAHRIATRALERNKQAIEITDERERPSSMAQTVFEVIKNTKEINDQISDVPEEKVEEAIEKAVKKVIDIPQNFAQAGYSATGYNEKGIPHVSKKGFMLDSSKEWHEGTNQRALHKEWVKEGKKYTNGIASMVVDGATRYLIALTDTFGKVGDLIDFEFGNGEKIKCIIADTKDRKDDNWNKYGHIYKTPSGAFQTNIIEFEVSPHVYNKIKNDTGNGNPTTKTWELPWKDRVENKKGQSDRNKIVKAYNYGNYKEI